jgi:phosphopantothenoylcysteine decarboxylase / phosphopantothenate---cysteine ligase
VPACIPLEATADVLRSTRDARRDGAVIVGFALQTGDGRTRARAKLRDKELDIIVLNRADLPDAGFDVDTNRVVFIHAAGGEETLPLQSKDDVAETLLDRIAALLP